MLSARGEKQAEKITNVNNFMCRIFYRKRLLPIVKILTRISPSTGIIIVLKNLP